MPVRSLEIVDSKKGDWLRREAIDLGRESHLDDESIVPLFPRIGWNYGTCDSRLRKLCLVYVQSVWCLLCTECVVP